MATVKTKFEIGATLHTLDKDFRFKTFKAARISVAITENGTDIYYGDSESTYSLVRENLCFSSKEELLRHIADSENA